MAKLVLIRHGQSEWNLSNQFTGWVDVDLSEKGVEQAKNAGKALRNTALNLTTHTFCFEACYQDFALCS